MSGKGLTLLCKQCLFHPGELDQELGLELFHIVAAGIVEAALAG